MAESNVKELPTRARVDEELARLAAESDQQAETAINAVPDHDVEGGKSIEQIAAEGGADPDEEQMQLLDFGDTLDLKLKGRKPTESQIKVAAISRDIRGQLGDIDDNETIVYVGRAVLKSVNVVNKRVEGKVTAKTRRHVLEPLEQGGFLPFRGVWAERLEALVTEMQTEVDSGIPV